jgi:hypothetical protein
VKKQDALTWAAQLSGEHRDDIDVYFCVYGEGIEIALTWQAEDGSNPCTYTITRIAQSPALDWLPTAEREGSQIVDTPNGPMRKDPGLNGGALLYECEVRSDSNAFEPYTVYTLFVMEYADYAYGKLQELGLSPEVIERLFDTIKPRYALHAYTFYTELVACMGPRTHELLLLLLKIDSSEREQILRAEGFKGTLLAARTLYSQLRGALVLCKAKVAPKAIDG